MAITIPGEGEKVGRYIRAFTIGLAAESPDVDLSTSTGTLTVNLVNITEPNVFVHRIDKQVVMQFDTATLTFTIGDSTDPDGYWTDTLFNLSASGSVFDNMATSVGYGAGKLYTSTQAIQLVQSTKISAGKAKLLIEYERGADTDLNPATSS